MTLTTRDAAALTELASRLHRVLMVGHLLECAGQITGGYFADPGYKDVPDLARLGFPIGEVGEDGALVITKVADSGGAVLIAAPGTTAPEQVYADLEQGQVYALVCQFRDSATAPRHDRLGMFATLRVARTP
jgi:hypothetical protein